MATAWTTGMLALKGTTGVACTVRVVVVVVVC